MPRNQKEAFFGLPEVLFNSIVTFLQQEAGSGSPAAPAALSALVSLAEEEHAAAATVTQPRTIDVVFRAIELREDLEALRNVPTASLPGALAAFKVKLDELKDFWYGR